MNMDYVFSKYNKRNYDPMVGYQNAMKRGKGIFEDQQLAKIAGAFDCRPLEFPEFGCILLFQSINNRQYNLELLFPDQWEYRLFKEKSYPVPVEFSMIYPGTLLKKDEDTFREKLTTEVLQSRLFGLTNDHKKQKTPVLIEYCIKKALGLPDVPLPSGGTTDVGKHTGTEPYDTLEHIWNFLVKRFVKDDVLWNRWMTWNHVCSMEFLVQNCAFQGFKECELFQMVMNSFAESSEVIQFPDLVQKCEQLKGEYQSKMEVASQKVADEYTFDVQQESNLKYMNYSIKECHQDLPAKDLLSKYVSPTGPIVPNIESIDELLLHLGNQDLKLVLKMTMVEDWFSLNAHVSACPSKIVKAIEQYEDLLQKWSSLDDYQSFPITEVRSRYSLITWIGYCMGHRFVRASKIHGAQTIGNSLDISLMKYWSLPSKRFRDASFRVFEYLEMFSDRPGLFCLKNDHFTIQFAREYAMQDEECLRMWSQFQQDLRTSIETRNAQVKAKKDLAFSIRLEIKELQLELQESESHLHGLLHQRFDARSWSWKEDCHYARNEVNSAAARLRRKKKELINVLQSPRFVVHSLPKELPLAAPILFFSKIPERLRSFGSLTMKAVTSMVPWRTHSWEETHGGSALANAQKYPSDLFDFTEHYSSRNIACCASDFPLVSGQIKIPQTFGQKTVDSIFDEMDGHWFPNYLRIDMIWKYGAPHEIIHMFVNEYFTPPVAKEFRFMVELPTESTTRGNIPYSSISKRGGLTYLAYTGLGSIRAYANVQLRRLLCELEAQNLPLSDSLVKNVIYSSLFQIGPLTNCYDHLDEWHHDFANDGLQKFEEILEKVLNNLKMTVHKASDMECVARLASFITQWLPESSLFTKIIDVNLNWIQSAAEKSTQLSSWADQCQGKGKEWLHNAYLILCFEFVPVNENHLLTFLTAMVSCQFLKLHALQSSFRKEIVRLAPIVSRICIQHLVKTTQMLEQCEKSCLTRIVKSFDFDCPDVLHWERLGNSSIYESRSQNFYTIDVQEGIFLQNGFPPSRLPQCLLQDEQYVQTFGNHEFEASLDSSGWFNTTKALRGYRYKFFLDDRLWIQEVHCKELENRNFVPLNDFKALVPNLPERLYSLYSHWWDSNRRCYVLRAVSFRNKRISNSFRNPIFDRASHGDYLFL
jgi:hypothetical protein